MSVKSSVEAGAPTSACPACGYIRDDPSVECPKCVESRKSVARLQEMLRPHLGGRYELIAKAGAGSAGDVYQARDTLLERDVAIKRVRLDQFSDNDERERRRERTVHEAKVAAKLKHSHIVTIHDILDTAEMCFIVMEYIDGPTLEQLLRKKKRLSLDETIELLAPTAEALDYAHANAVVHRDVKPSNIMIETSKIDGSREVKVTDFGIAKSEASKELTAAGDILGSPNYMSPEQAAGKSVVTAASDLFSLASIAYECLTGRRAFRAPTAMKTLMAIIQEEPPPIDCEELGLDPDIVDVFARALAKEPTERYGSGGEFLEALLSLPQREVARDEPEQDDSADVEGDEKEAVPDMEVEAEGEAEAEAEAESSEPEPVEEEVASPRPSDAEVEATVEPPPITPREPGESGTFDPRLEGVFRDAELARVSRDVYSTRHSGILHLAGDDTEKRIYFKEGNIVFANSNLEADRLGEFLVRSRQLEREQLEKVMAAMRRNGARLGKTLVELELLGQADLDDAVRRQIEAIVFSIFRWDQGSYRFELLSQPVAEDIAVDLSTENLILSGVRQIDSLERIQSALGELDRVVRQSDDAPLLFQRMTLTTSEGFVLSRVDGATSVAEITSMSPLGDEETLRCIYTLVAAGVLELPGGLSTVGEPSRRLGAAEPARPRTTVPVVSQSEANSGSPERNEPDVGSQNDSGVDAPADGGSEESIEEVEPEMAEATEPKEERQAPPAEDAEDESGPVELERRTGPEPPPAGPPPESAAPEEPGSEAPAPLESSDDEADEEAERREPGPDSGDVGPIRVEEPVPDSGSESATGVEVEVEVESEATNRPARDGEVEEEVPTVEGDVDTLDERGDEIAEERGAKEVVEVEGQPGTAEGRNEASLTASDPDLASLDSGAPADRGRAPVSSEEASKRQAAAQHYLRARQLYEQSDFSAAAERLRDAIDLSPEPSFHKLLAICLANDPECREEAAEHFRQALQSDDGDVECLLRLAEVYEALERRALAAETYAKVLEQEPENQLAQEKVKLAAPPKKKRGLRALARMMVGRSKD